MEVELGEGMEEERRWKDSNYLMIIRGYNRYSKPLFCSDFS